jgi:alkanesulfonate monooxygenase
VGVHFYSVTPETFNECDPTAATYPDRLRLTVRRAEDNGFLGILVPHSLHEIDPWMVAAKIGAETTSLRPLIATQPTAIPPHTAAQAGAAYAAMYGRPLDFNLVAGANPTEMQSVGETMSKEGRYARLRSWALVLRRLLNGEVVNWDDEYFCYREFVLRPCPDALKLCRFFMAGSSAASQVIAAEVADVAVTHPLPFDEWSTITLPQLREAGFDGALGIRVGVLARDSAREAWDLARERFPRTWRGDQETNLKTISTNTWSKQLAAKALAADRGGEVSAEADGVYWLGAFVNGGASAPMLVGSYNEVATALGQYALAGVRHVILTGIHDDDYLHTKRVIDLLPAI